MLRLVLAAALLAAACGPGAQKSTQHPEPEAAAAPAPDTETPDAREKLLAQTLARAAEIQDEVAAVRDLAFEREVPAERQSRDEFSKFVATELEKELTREESEATSTAYHHLGFLEKKIDLLAALADVTTAQVAAYYNPETGKFYAVSLSSDQTWLEVMTAHELTHGLQDQHFDLRAYYGEKSDRSETEVELTEDQLNARRFVVEGEASFVMLLHMAAKQSGKLSAIEGLAPGERRKQLAAIHPQVRMMVAMIAGTPWQTLADETAEQSKKIDGLDAEQAESMKEIPPLILVPMLESYTRGALTIAEVHRAGGWDAVARLYAEPPESTEQVLHAAEKLAGPRDYPTAVSLPDYRERHGEPLLDETVGELGWRVYFETWKVEAAAEAAAGWDGDRVIAYRAAGGPLGLAAVTFDSARDAEEFAAAYATSLARRFPGEKKAKSGPGVSYRRPDGSLTLMQRRGRDVFIVDGASAGDADAALRALIAKTTKKTDAREKASGNQGSK